MEFGNAVPPHIKEAKPKLRIDKISGIVIFMTMLYAL